MAEFQRMDGSKLPAAVTTVAGSTLSLKVIPTSKEPLPTVSASPEAVAKVINVKPRTGPHFTTFQLQAVSVGEAKLQATGDKGAVLAGPVAITVEAKITIPAASTTGGMWALLFLAETPSPEASGYTLADARTSMTWMRVVVENRLRTPSHLWASKDAKSLTDVIKATGQFEGFSKYPVIATKIQTRINETVAIANDGNDPRRSKYKEFVQAALDVAALNRVSDPSEKGLYWWRTEGSGSPTSSAKVYMTKLGNTFYTPK